MARPLSLSVVLLVVCVVSIRTTTALRFSLSPSHTLTEWVDPIASFFCQPDVSNPKVLWVDQIILNKLVGGRWEMVAKFDTKNKLTKSSKYKNHIKGAGAIFRNVKDSYLLINIQQPVPADSGTYQCVVEMSGNSYYTAGHYRQILTVKKDQSGVIG